MTDTRLTARRATVEDLPQLMSLWHLEQLPAAVLEKRFTEFQVVVDDAGQVLAALGLQVTGTQGCLHSEAIARAEWSDQLRMRLWQRIEIIIRNHALERLWTTLNSLFWRELGFETVTAEQLNQLPPAFQSTGSDWSVLVLRAGKANEALQDEFAQLKAFRELEKTRMANRARWAKRIALTVTVIVFLLVVVWAVVLLTAGPKLFRR